MAHVAFLGTGLLGSGLVEAMLRRGDIVTVWNRTEAKARRLESLGARVAVTPADAVAGADRVHMTLPDDEVVDQMIGGFVGRLKPSAVIVDHSTTSPKGTKARIERMEKSGVAFLHAPVFMSPQMARDAVGLMMVSGPQALFDRIADDLKKMTGEVWYVGTRGDLAAAYKLFGNSMLFVITAGLADVFAMAKANDVPLPDAVSVFDKFKVANAISYRGQKMARGDFDATFELTMARKDMRLMLEAAAGHQTMVLAPIAKRMDEAIANGHGSHDLGAIAAELVR
ncbi:MAG TPA: NAD(P)-dependent oxidoreductase [Vicinamibacterales bacterium]|nr:NAD(P)-dependent oxidoreductase [Vicinamibacterales bacterium]